MSGLHKDATQMASWRTASQLLLQMAIEATDQNVKEIYFVKNSSVKFYENVYKKSSKLSLNLQVHTRFVGSLQDWLSTCDKVQPQNWVH